MRIIAVDDEPLALNYMLKLLAECEPEAEINGFKTPSQALSYVESHAVDVAVLDIEMTGMNGIALAMGCKRLCPRLNIIFATGYCEYALEAMRMHASGYLMKPIIKSELRAELDTLRNPPAPVERGKPRVQTFGNFEVYWHGKPLKFARSKCKECLAYLVDRRGAQVSVAELAGILWDERPYDRTVMNNTGKIISDLRITLQSAGLKELLIKEYNSLALDTSRVECDLYGALAGDVSCLNAFTGEYMAQYSWAESTLGTLWQAME